MYGVVAIATVKESEIEKFESIVKVLEKQVLSESGCASFYVFKVKGVAGSYKLLEVYDSKDAFKVHVKTDHFAHAMPLMEACFAAPMQVETMEGL